MLNTQNSVFLRKVGVAEAEEVQAFIQATFIQEE
jgi:hypothetical protein